MGSFSDTQILGGLATLIAFVSYIPYIWTTLKGTTKPHGFMWFIFGLLMAIGFAAQISDHAGPGAWMNGFSAIVCFFIAFLAFFKGTYQATRTDWMAFLGALAAIPVWLATDDPLYAVILITVIDALGFYPTFRKTYFAPHDELLFTYNLSVIKLVISLLAIENVTIVTTLYPASLVFMNGLFVIVILIRRKVVS